MSWEIANQRSQIKGEILIGVPYRSGFSAKFVSGILGVQYPDYFAHSIYFETGLPLDIARNTVISNGLQRNVTHIVFLDADIVLKSDTLTKLKLANFPIVSGVYFGRNPPYNAVANINNKPITRETVVSRRNAAPNGRALMEVHDVGMGCCMIDIRVFQRIAKFHNLRWYCMLRHPDQLAQIEQDDTGISYDNDEAKLLGYRCKYCGNTLIAKFFDYRIGKESKDSLSEDYYFCKLARQCGFQVYLSLDAEVEHEITMFTIDSNGLTNSTTSAGVV